MGRPATIVPGLRRGKLVVIERHASGTSKHPQFLVRCDCGAEYVTSGGTLSKALGCKKCRPGGAKRKYGDRLIADNQLYGIWASMRHRCNPDATAEDTKRWAGRGISVCHEWHKFEVFEKWALSNGYEPGLTIDRVDNDGNYEPTNCEWVTRSENSKRARALYHFVPKAVTKYAYRYDEDTYGDF